MREDMFHARMKEARSLAGVSQAGLALVTGLHATAISHFESGTRRPSLGNLRRLARGLDVTSDYLLGLAPDRSHARDDCIRAEERDRLASEAERLRLDWWNGSTRSHALDKSDGPAMGQFAEWLRAGGEQP